MCNAAVDRAHSGSRLELANSGVEIGDAEDDMVDVKGRAAAQREQ